MLTRAVECEICGKRVMALAAHMKIHTKNAINNQIEEKTALDITSELLGTPGTKSKRAAAQKCFFTFTYTYQANSY